LRIVKAPEGCGCCCDDEGEAKGDFPQSLATVGVPEEPCKEGHGQKGKGEEEIGRGIETGQANGGESAYIEQCKKEPVKGLEGEGLGGRRGTPRKKKPKSKNDDKGCEGKYSGAELAQGKGGEGKGQPGGESPEHGKAGQKKTEERGYKGVDCRAGGDAQQKSAKDKDQGETGAKVKAPHGAFKLESIEEGEVKNEGDKKELEEGARSLGGEEAKEKQNKDESQERVSQSEDREVPIGKKQQTDHG
jgi:hypothetical protein